MTVHDSRTLRSLISAYDNAYIFVDPVPNALRVSKIFTGMKRSNGGLVLLGVREDGTVVGVAAGTVDGIYRRFEKMCAKLTPSSVEIGSLKLGDATVVFLVFNPIPQNLAPLERYSGQIKRVAMV